MKTAIAAVVLFLLLPFNIAHATDALSFGQGYMIGVTPQFPYSGGLPSPGDPVTLYGLISAVGPPFADLAPAPGYELTFSIDGVCQGTGNWDDFNCQNGGIFALFEVATLSIYLDSSPSVYLLPGTYSDGEVVLQADVFRFDLLLREPTVNCPADPPDVVLDFQFTGGGWFDRVSQNGQGAYGNLYGELTGNGNEQLIGYTLFLNGTINPEQPVATQQSTWGAVKAMYR